MVDHSKLSDISEMGRRLKRFRVSKGLTLRAVANEAGCSPSFVSGVENGRISPSISSLKRIANALQCSVVDLFATPGSSGEPVVTTPSDRTTISMKRWKATINLLTSNTANKRMAPFYTVIQPGGGAKGSYSHEGEEFGIVLEGELEINLDGTNYKICEQESFYYSSRIPHYWINQTKKTTIVLWVVSPPSW